MLWRLHLCKHSREEEWEWVREQGRAIYSYTVEQHPINTQESQRKQEQHLENPSYGRNGWDELDFHHKICSNDSLWPRTAHLDCLIAKWTTHFYVRFRCILPFKSLNQYFFWTEMNTFIQQGCIKLIKGDMEFQFQMNAVLLNFIFC